MSGPKSICSIKKEERKKKERGMECEKREGGRKDGRKKGGERERKKSFFSNENICKLKTKSNDFNAVMVIVPDKSVEQFLFCGIVQWAVGVQGCQHGTGTEAEEQWYPN